MYINFFAIPEVWPTNIILRGLELGGRGGGEMKHFCKAAPNNIYFKKSVKNLQ